MVEPIKPVSPAPAQTKVEPEIINVGILLRYFCPSCGRECAGQDQAELTAANDYSQDFPAWPNDGKPRSCRHCKTEIKTLPIAVSYIKLDPKG